VLHRALLVATPRIAESAIEKVVASESREMPVLLPVRSLENLGYRRFEVVVNALRGDSVEELEGQTMPRQERLQALVGEGVNKGGSAVTKPHAEQMHPSFFSPEAYHRLPPIHLSLFPRGGLQGKKTLLRGDLFFYLRHDLADDGFTSLEPSFRHQTVVHPPGRVTLLAGGLEVLHKPGPDDLQIGPRYRAGAGTLEGIGGALKLS